MMLSWNFTMDVFTNHTGPYDFIEPAIKQNSKAAILVAALIHKTKSPVSLFLFYSLINDIILFLSPCIILTKYVPLASEAIFISIRCADFSVAGAATTFP